jgi:hypothetical protein
VAKIIPNKKNPYMTAGAHLTINLKLNFSSVQIDDLFFKGPDNYRDGFLSFSRDIFVVMMIQRNTRKDPEKIE